MTLQTPAVLLVGCGDIAQRLAALLRKDFQLTGLRRRTENLPTYIAPVAVDIGNIEQLNAVLRHALFDYVVVTLTPGERSEARYRQVYVDGARNLLSVLQGQPHLLFVSSTSVYDQDRGEVVDESSSAVGKGFSGRCLLEAEQLVKESGLPATVVRFSGIYAANRGRLLAQVREGAVDAAQATQWTNRIHAEDAARVLAHLIRQRESGTAWQPVYIASDCCPVRAGEVWQWLAEQLAVSDPLATADWRSAATAGKQCSNALLLQTGFQFLYPNFREGYQQVLAVR